MSDESFLAAARCEPLRVYGSSRCVCRSAERDTKMAVSGGLRIIRLRYGLPYSELPDLSVDRLGDYLLYLLAQGQVRATVSFPRRQVRPDGDGLVSLSRLGRRERWGFAHSVNSLKRNLPSGCRRHSPTKRLDWASNAFSSPPPTSPDYLAFVRREVARLFPVGWDRSYPDRVRRFVPRPSSREQASFGGPGLRADHLWKGRREEFLHSCLEEDPALPDRLRGRYKEVLSAGKVRPLLIFDQEVDLLGPLNETVYDFLSRKPWLLKGPPTEARMANICINRWQTSVDLVNATDGLALDVADEILKGLFFSSLAVPRSLRRLAFGSLRADVRTGNGVHMGTVSHGQMMGAYLSFPLLCIQSYLAARWAARFDQNATFLVNGDDCVISASRPVLSVDYPAGFKLNNLKTIRSESVAEVNSTCFLREGRRWVLVDHLRRGSVLPSFAGLLHAARACSGSSAWSTAFVKARLGRKWGCLPSQLGLNRSSHAAWRRETSMRKTRLFTELPGLGRVPLNPGVEWCSGSPDPDETEALAAFFFAHGRDGGDQREYLPSIGEIRRSYRYRKVPLWRPLSYRGWAVDRPTPARDSYLCPADYESCRYLGRLAALLAFRRAVGL